MHFQVFAKNFRRPWMKVKHFFCQFPNPWALRVSGMGGYTLKCEKSQNHCTLLCSVHYSLQYSYGGPLYFSSLWLSEDLRQRSEKGFLKPALITPQPLQATFTSTIEQKTNNTTQQYLGLYWAPATTHRDRQMQKATSPPLFDHVGVYDAIHLLSFNPNSLNAIAGH